MVKRIGENFCVYSFCSYTYLGKLITSLNLLSGKSLILGSLVEVFTDKIPDSENKLFEVIKIDLENGIFVKDLETESIFILKTNEIMIH